MGLFGGILGSVVGGLGGGLLDSLGGDPQADARNANQAREQRLLAGLRDERGLQTRLYNDILGVLGESEQAVLDDVNRGIGRAEDLGRSARRETIDRGRDTAAALDQDLISRGLHGSSTATNLQRGVAADVSRGLADINNQQAGLLSGLYSQRAGVRGGLTGQRLGAMSQYGNRSLGLTQLLSNSLTSIQDVAAPQPSFASQFGQLGGLLGVLGTGSG